MQGIQNEKKVGFYIDHDLLKQKILLCLYENQLKYKFAFQMLLNGKNWMAAAQRFWQLNNSRFRKYLT